MIFKMILKLLDKNFKFITYLIYPKEIKDISEVPNLSQDDNQTSQDTPVLPQINQINWVECEDVYKPIPKPIQEFITEREINLPLPQVYISEEAHDNLISHLEADVSVEHGGILFGQAYTDFEHGIYVEITAAVAAPRTIGTGAHLEFTSESWQGIMNHAKEAHPEANIVGWYHSHPNLGVFMSGTDMNTQRAFFYHPWCVSIVCDPVRKHIGYFLGIEAEKVKPVVFKQTVQARSN